MKNIFIKSTAAVVLAGFLSSTAMAKEQVTLLVHHFLSPNSPVQTKLLEPWAKKIQKDSNGRLKIEIYPSMTMGGKPPELFKQARDGTADIVWTLAGYTSGVFTRTEVFELPTVHRGNSIATTLAIYDNFDLIKGDYKKIKPLLVHALAGNALHTINKKVTSLKDVKGLKLRSPSRTGAWYIEEMGAEPVGMPLPELPQALSKGVVDGALVPFEVFPPYKFYQLTKYSVEGKDLDRFGTSVAMLLMNEKRFKSLPKDLQKVLEKNTGRDFYKLAGEIWLNEEEPGKKLQKESEGSEIIKLNKDQMGEFNKIGEKVVQKWIKEVGTKGIDGQLLVEKAREAIKKNTK